MTGPQAAAWYLRVQAAVIEDRQSKTLLTDETLQRLRALRQRQWQKAAADFLSARTQQVREPMHQSQHGSRLTRSASRLA